VDFNSFDDAHNASVSGDTIQIYGRVIPLRDVTKRLVIMGFGYNFDVNPDLQAVGTDAPSSISAITFNSGSENSMIEGCEVNNGIELKTSNITIRRCSAIITLNNNDNSVNNTMIQSCVVRRCTMANENGKACNNTNIYNSILADIIFYNQASTGSIINCVGASHIVFGPQLHLNLASFLVKNCILPYYNNDNVYTVYENDFLALISHLPCHLEKNNRWSQNWGALFNRLGNADDGPSIYILPSFDEDYYILKAGSPAINGGFDAANNPTDAGIYGGEPAYRYKLSGVPAVPAIYKLTASDSSATSNPYNITISVRSNN
jgi:hypothetical protein